MMKNIQYKINSIINNRIYFKVKFILIIVFLLLLFILNKQVNAEVCEAVNEAHCYYIAPNGSDSNAGTFNQPLASTNPIINSLHPGDFVYFRGGNYKAGNRGQIVGTGNSNRYALAYLRNVNGTSDKLITLKAYPGELPIIDLYDLNPEFNPTDLFGEPRDAFSIYSGSYIKISGFEIIHGSIHLWNNPHHIWIENNHVHDLLTFRDNNGLILLHFAQNVYIRNNKLHDTYERGIKDPDNPDAPCDNGNHSGCILNTIKSHQDPGHNGCITTLSGDIYVGYGNETSGPFEIVGNDIYDCPTKFFIKNPQGEVVDENGLNMTIRNNYLHGAGYLFYSLHSSNTLFQNNLCKEGCRSYFVGDREYPNDDYPEERLNEIDARNIIFKNNVFLNLEYGFSLRGVGFLLSNGIYSNALCDKFKFENNILFMSEATNSNNINWNSAGYMFSNSYVGQTDLITSPIPSKILSRIISKNNCIVNELGENITFMKQFQVDENNSVQDIVGYTHANAITNFNIDGAGDSFPTDFDLNNYFIDATEGNYQNKTTSLCTQNNIGLSNPTVIQNIINNGVGLNQLTIIRANVDQNSSINSTDGMLTLRNSLGLDMSTTNWQISDTTGDVNCDDGVNSTDALLILRYSLGLSMSETGWCVE